MEDEGWIAKNGRGFCYPTLLSHVFYPCLLSHVLLSIPPLPCFAILPSSPMFCYPSLLSHVLLSIPHQEGGIENMGDEGGIAKHRR
jgi:hypothetical protein